MGLLAPPPTNREFGTRMNSSAYGQPYTVVMGTGQVSQDILWVDGFASTAAPTGKGAQQGGGKGGGKGGQYLYSADIVVALCCGPIQGVADVWSGQSWLGSPRAAESYTIAGPSYIYTPTNAANFGTDLGVGVQNAYSASYNDLGAPSPTVLSGNYNASLTRVTYGTTLTTGLYSINPTGNVYHFAAADVGRVVVTNYSYLVTNINRQETDIVPAGRTISVSGVGAGSTVNGDLGVVYTLTGVAFTTGSGTGQYTVTGSNPAVYHFAAGDINAEVTISYTVNDPNAVSPGEARSLNYTLNNGTQSQSPYAFLTASYPDAAFGYTSIATLLYQPMDMGMGAQVQENRFEVVTYDIYGQGIQDCNPVQCIYKVLTNQQWGLGVGTIPFPTACIDNGGSGTWGGAPATPGTSPANGTAWNWFASQNFFISPVIDSQNSAASEISKWLEAGMCAAYYSEGLLKLRPYGDTSAAANGVTWTAPSTYVVALDDTCFKVDKEGEDPVKISRVSAHDAWNVVQVQWNNRLNQYAPEITQESDQGLINRWGERREDPQNWDAIHTIQAATFAANMRIKHNSYIRNTYEFTLPYTYSYLEPMDIVPISTTSIWAANLNNTNLDVVNLPVRILKIVDDPEKGLQITAEDYPWGAHQPTLYNKQLNESVQPANAYADPGNSEVVMFEATGRLTLFTGDQIWIGALGTSANWGSTNIWVSQTSGGTYKCVGTIKTPARLGELNATFASGSDPDTTNTLVVNLAENCGMLDAGSSTDADSGNTMCFVDGEIISYSALSYTGQGQVSMGTYIRRGQYGSTISSHATNSLFLRLDASIFKYTYDPAWRGQTLYFKYQSVNAFGLMEQDLSTLTPVAFTLPGTNPGSIDASSGLLLPAANPSLYSGNYNNSTAYIIGNEVTYNDQYYVCILGTTGHLPTNVTYWQPVTGNNIFTSVCASGGSSAWYKVGTIVFGAVAESVSFEFLAGQGYNTTTNQQTTTKIVMRTGNNGSAPNLSGLTWTENGGASTSNACVLAVKAAATGGSTSASNLSWDLYIEVAAFSSGTLIVNAGQDCSWTLSNSATSDPGVASTTVVVGIGGYGLNGVNDGTSSFSATASTLTYRPTTNPLTGHDAGSNTTINIASFTMRTSSKGDVSISSGSVTALSYSTLYYIYYDDAKLAGGAVTYHATTTKETAINGVGRFFVGSLVTPAATAPDTTGNNDGGIGAQSGNTSVFLFGAAAAVDTSTGTNSVTNPTNSYDGNLTTACVMAMTSVASGGLSGTINATLTMSAASPTAAPWSSLTLYVVSSITGVANLGHCDGKIQYSLDGGNSYTNIYDQTNANRALTTDAVTLPNGQNLSLVRVKATESSLSFTNHADMTFSIYEAYVVGQI